MKHNDDNVVNFRHEHEDCDGDCNNCGYIPATLDDLARELYLLRFESLMRNAYDMGMISKKGYIETLEVGLMDFNEMMNIET